MSPKDPKTTGSEFNHKEETAKAMSKRISLGFLWSKGNRPDDFECYFNNWQVAADLITLRQRSKDFQHSTEHSDSERTAC